MDDKMPSFTTAPLSFRISMKVRAIPSFVHGFASSKNVNWAYPGWASVLTKAGRRVIALDLRGHGESTKLYDSRIITSAPWPVTCAR
jgi:hypothetical protein